MTFKSRINAVTFFLGAAVLGLFLGAWGASLMAGCSRLTPPPYQPDVVVEAGPVQELDAGPDAPSTCERSCTHLRKLGCAEGESTPGGQPCEAVCENLNESGLVVLDSVCVLVASSCDAAVQCLR